MDRRTAGRPRDRFDDVPVDLARVGAHRAPVRRRGLGTFAWAALATGVLVGAGVLGLAVIERGVTATGDSARASVSSTAAPAPTVDPAATVVMLNGTKTTGLAARAAAIAKRDGWRIATTGNADTQNVKLSTVYYSDRSARGAALGLARSLGIGQTQQTRRFDVQGATRLTVVLGSDFTPA